MKHLGRIFSALTLFVLIAAVWVLLPKFHLPPQRLPDQPPDLTQPLTGRVDLILVEKAARKMTLFQDGTAVRIWPIALGFDPEGDKIREGDGKTPEGLFTIDRINPRSQFTLSLGLDYPQAEDRARAKAGGYDPGGDIMIHGQPNAMPVGMKGKGDWTAGCIALINSQMRELWEVAGVGTKVEIRP